jgi:hypothetical protein
MLEACVAETGLLALQAAAEKSALERKIKMLEAQSNKQSKELEKKDGVCNRKIESVQEVQATWHHMPPSTCLASHASQWTPHSLPCTHISRISVDAALSATHLLHLARFTAL